MGKYICTHGHIKADCTVCVAIDEAVSEYMLPNSESSDAEYAYDFFLDLDERLLRESEEE